MIGQVLGHYRIESKLGQGGMGVVYKARDLHLDRPVAIKVLPAEAVADPQRKRRLVQEAKAASALNHPNILSVYDIDSSGSAGHAVDFMAMEYIEGQSLDERIGPAGLGVKETLKYAVQIASGLAAAHAAGIVHRDIKPGNLMVTDQGLVKILDFGLAKLPEPDESSYQGATQTVQPETEEGAILGTVSYMSPEQAQGKKVDARSDVFSFGCVLYEMLTGRRPFQEETKLATLSAILHKEPPPVREIAAGTSAELEKLTAHCLAKDPARRLHSMADVELMLEDVRDATPAVPITAAPGQRRWLPILLAAGAVTAAAVAVAVWLSSPGPDLTSYRLTPFATEAGEENSPAWSPDGKALAYVTEVDGLRQVYTRSLDAPAGTRVTNSPSDCYLPFWSPDRSRIYYVSQGNLWSVGAAGGVPQLEVKDANAASLSPDGSALVFSRGAFARSGLWIASPPAASPRPYRQPPLPEQAASIHPPQFSPDGTKIAVPISRQAGATGTELWILPYPSGAPRRVLARLSETFQNQRLSWMPDSRHVVFSGTTDATGSRLYLADTETGHTQPLTATTSQESQPAVSPDGGRVAFASGANDFDVVEIALDGSRQRTLLATARSEAMPTWSPSGAEYAYVTNANGGAEIWLRGAPTGLSRPVVRGDLGLPWSRLARPRFSPDGQRIAYDVIGPQHLIGVSSVAGGRPLILDRESTDQHGPSWSPDGNWIAYPRLNAGKWELVKTPLGGGKPVPLDEAAPGGGDTDWSPNGAWICHLWNDLLRLVSADGQIHEVLHSPETAAFGFSRDSATLYAVRRSANRKWELAAFSVPGGQEKKVTPLNVPVSASISGFSLHPSGKSFATSVGAARYDIWLLEGFPQPRRWGFHW